ASARSRRRRRSGGSRWNQSGRDGCIVGPVGGTVRRCYLSLGSLGSRDPGLDARCTLPRRPATARRGPRERPTWREAASIMAMSRSSSWKEYRLSDRLEWEGAAYSVDLVARKATGVQGWKVTLVYLPREG